MAVDFLDQIIAKVSSCSGAETVVELQDVWQSVVTSDSVADRLLVDFGSLLRDAQWRSSLVRRSRETATHYVWSLAAGATGHPRLCIHEYKNHAEVGSGHANSIHNHRYDFVSHILQGGYTHEEFSVKESGGSPTDVEAPVRRQASHLASGQSIVLDHRTFHRVTHIQSGTFTAVLKTAPRKDYSVSFSALDRAPVQHYPLPARALLLMKRLTPDESGAQPSGT